MLRIVAHFDGRAIRRATLLGFVHRARPERRHRAQRWCAHLVPTNQVAHFGERGDKPFVPEEFAFMGHLIHHAGHWRYRQIEPMPVERAAERVGRAFYESQTHQWRLGGKRRHADAEEATK